MKRLVDALSRLEATARAPLGHRLANTVDPETELEGLLRSAVLLSRGRAPHSPLSQATVELARRAWAEANGDVGTLPGRYVRALCSDPDVATTRGFVDALRSSSLLHGKRRWIEGMIASYFARWRPPSATSFEALLTQAVTTFDGKSSRIAICKPVAEQLFSARAARVIGSRILKDRKRWETVLAEWGVERASSLGEAVANAAVDEWIAWFKDARASWAKNGRLQLSFLFEVVLAPGILSHGQLSKAISELVLWPAIEKDEELVEVVRSSVLKHPGLGDPRHKPANWAECDPEAYRRIRAWFSRYDLEFFFKFVIRDDPHKRKAFWLDYIDKVEGDSRVALCELDAQRVRAHTREKLRYSKVVGSTSVSAFMMRFPGSSVVLVEFSQPGNALFCHDGKKFNEVVRGGINQPALHIGDDLKNKHSMKWRVVHRDGWQFEVRNKLALLGIRP